MIFIVNSLTFNGGTTFVLRFAKECKLQDKKIKVLILTSRFNNEILLELQEYAEVIFFKDLVYFGFKWTAFNLLVIFMPFKKSLFKKRVLSEDNNIHVMGLFGLLFGLFLQKKYKNEIKLSLGVYQQNEYMFHFERFYFARKMISLFKNLRQNQIIFVNDANLKSYSQFFNINYKDSLILPIGIKLESEDKSFGSYESKKIISIGNLVPFKTYNEIMIRLMPRLIKIDNFTYEVYGEGSEMKRLQNLIDDLGLQEKVKLKGRVSYSQFKETLKDAFLFVGSGTSIIESSAMGIPSIVGIELINEPKTYGFFSDILGFSYNELEDDRELFEIESKILTLNSSKREWEEIGNLCKNKSKEFSITKTVDGFFNLDIKIDEKEIKFSKFKLFCSFIYISVLHITKIDRSFENRKSQNK